MPVLALLVLATIVAAVSAAPSVERAAGALRVELSLAKAAFVVGEPVVATLTARATGGSPLRVQFRSGQRFDLTVRRRGALIWRWSDDKGFIQMIGDVTIPPREPLRFQVTWEQIDLQARRVEPGEYEAVGVFLGYQTEGGRPVETPPLAFQIIRR